MPAAKSVSRLGGCRREWMGILVASLIFLLVVIVCYMCVQAFKAYNPNPCKDGFQPWHQYRPACSSPWLGGRRSCRGRTTGAMPEIDGVDVGCSGPCCANIAYGDIPPPAFA